MNRKKRARKQMRAKKKDNRREDREDRKRIKSKKKNARREDREDRIEKRGVKKEKKIMAKKSAKIARQHAKEVKYQEKSEGGAYSAEHAEAMWGGIADTAGNVAMVAGAVVGAAIPGDEGIGEALQELGPFGGGGEEDQGPYYDDEGPGELGPLGFASPMVEYGGMALLVVGVIVVATSGPKKHAA